MSETKTKPSFTQSVDVQLLVKEFLKKPEGTLVTYDEIKALIGRDPQTKGRPAVHSAIRILSRQHQILYVCVMTRGYQRATPVEALDSGQSTIRTIHRATKRGAVKLSCSDYAKLSKDDKVRHDASASLLGLIAQTTTVKSQKTIADAAEKAHEKIPIGRTMQLFLD